MIGLVMAGGKGTRMSTITEKLLLEYKQPVVLNTINVLKKSKLFSKIIAATSKNSPKTQNLLSKTGIEIFETSGRGYVTDLNSVLQSQRDELVLVVPGDLPLLDEEIIAQIVSKYSQNNLWTSFLVSKEFTDSKNIKLEYEVVFQNKKCYYTGISLVNPNMINKMKSVPETYVILDDRRITINLNTMEDYQKLLGTT